MRALMTAGDAGPVAPGCEAVRLEEHLEEHRGALTAHCRGILGSASETDDAVQETLVRAWCAFEQFEGRGSLRSWLFRIATNMCFDMLRATQRRARPIDLSSHQPPDVTVDAARSDIRCIRPIPGSHASGPPVDPAEQAVTREAVRHAFVVALLHLPPRQRSVLILREVLRWNAIDVAELLGTTVAAVNSALQRARSNLAASHTTADQSHPRDAEQRPLLQSYVDAFERYDLDSLVSLLQRAAPASGMSRRAVQEGQRP
jgi:RNA polymerase sigma-70 factor (ECF subfamily)